MLTNLQIATQEVREKSQLFVSKHSLRRRGDGRDG
jgi:hypothetical protein